MFCDYVYFYNIWNIIYIYIYLYLEVASDMLSDANNWPFDCFINSIINSIIISYRELQEKN